MGAKVKNPRKSFMWSITFVKHPVNPYLFQKITIPEVTVEQVEHADINRDVKTAGRIKIGNLIAEKLETTSGSDTWISDWISSCQDQFLGGGLIPSQYWETILVSQLAEDGQSILNTWTCTEVWPTKINGRSLDRAASENSIDTIEFSVGTCDKL